MLDLDQFLAGQKACQDLQPCPAECHSSFMEGWSKQNDVLECIGAGNQQLAYEKIYSDHAQEKLAELYARLDAAKDRMSKTQDFIARERMQNELDRSGIMTEINTIHMQYKATSERPAAVSDKPTREEAVAAMISKIQGGKQ